MILWATKFLNRDLWVIKFRTNSTGMLTIYSRKVVLRASSSSDFVQRGPIDRIRFSVTIEKSIFPRRFSYSKDVYHGLFVHEK
jgi:hypothetical protein